MTYYDASVRARALLVDAGISPDTATLDADLLARHAVQWDLVTWLSRRSEPATADFTQDYESLIKRRLTREPIAYIRGRQEFWSREFVVSPAVLIPRPETELIVERASQFLAERPGAVIIDVGTGSGCIAVTLALEHPDTTVYATDISEAALCVARANATRLGAGRIRFLRSSMLDAVRAPVDLIVSNPPYVAERDKPGLSSEVREHEPSVALFGGHDGWREIRALLRDAQRVLTCDGLLLMEMGYGQSEQIAAEVRDVPGLELVDVAPDLQGIPRVAIMQRTSLTATE